MGLDAVTLVYAVEQGFDLHLPEEEATAIETPGDLHDWVCAALATTPMTCPSRQVFYRLRKAFVKAGAKRQAITPDAPTASVFDPAQPRRAWRALGRELGLRMPRLQRPRPVRYTLGGLAALSVASGLACLLGTASAGTTLAAGAGWCAGRALTTPLAIHLPESCVRLRGLVGEIRGLNPGRFPGRDRGWTQEQVWQRLRMLIATVLSVPEDRVTPGAHFVHDLGAD